MDSGTLYPHCSTPSLIMVKPKELFRQRILMKVKHDKKDPNLALLDWRNMPLDDINFSPVQILMCCQTRTQLPTMPELLQPQNDTMTIKQGCHSSETKKFPDFSLISK